MKQHHPGDPSRKPPESPQPGKEYQMDDPPQFDAPSYKGSEKLKGKVAVITGGDSGIGRSVAILFAREGADVVIPYLNEDKDAEETKRYIEAEGQGCLLIPGDLKDSSHCKEVVKKTVEKFHKIDILVNNAAVQFPQKSLLEITDEQLEDTFRTNIFSYFYLTRAVLPFLKEGSAIINTASITAYRGSKELLDYSATKGAVVSFTRSLAIALAPEKIRVNAVAPGPVWTPLITSSFPNEKVNSFGENVTFGRPGQPEEIAPAFVYLASDDSSYMSGQVLHPNGGEAVNG